LNLEKAVELNRRKQREQRWREFGSSSRMALAVGVCLVGQSILLQLLVPPFPLLRPVESNGRI
jgi:hypothetical protein